MCLSGESSDAIIFRKSRIKFHETYCTKLLIPRILLFRHKDLKSLSRERSRAKIRNFQIVVQKSNFKTQQHTNLTYLFQIPKGCCKFNPYLLISAGNRRFFVRRKRAKFKNRKSSRYWTCDTSGQRSVSSSCIVKPNVTKSHGPLQVYLSTLNFLTAFLQLKKKRKKKNTTTGEKKKDTAKKGPQL